MLSNTQLRYLWCVLASGVLLMPILPSGSWIYQIVITYDSNRWVHFLVYTAVAAIPVAAWRRRASVLFSLSIAVLGTALEFLQMFIPSLIGRPQNALADLFGIGAGILFGLNIRAMHNSAESSNSANPHPSRSTLH
jgi:hypothetical protein